MKFPLMLIGFVLAGTGCRPVKDSPPVHPESLPAGSAATDQTAKSTMDLTGHYRGLLPCADCAGIETSIHLDADQTYTFSFSYKGRGEGKTFTTSGHYTWNPDGKTIRLEGLTLQPDQYVVGHGSLTQLDMEGKPIKGQLADRYVLSKQ